MYDLRLYLNQCVQVWIILTVLNTLKQLKNCEVVVSDAAEVDRGSQNRSARATKKTINKKQKEEKKTHTN